MIKTPRLTLKPFTDEDEGVIIPLLMCPEFMIYSPTGALDLNGAKQRFSDLVSSSERDGLGKLAVVVNTSGVLIGYCGIEMCEIEGTNSAELGFRIQSNYRGMGYATEAATAVLKQTELMSLGSIIAFTEPANTHSMRVLGKLGFRRIGESFFEGMAIILFGQYVK